MKSVFWWKIEKGLKAELSVLKVINWYSDDNNNKKWIMIRKGDILMDGRGESELEKG